MKKNPGRKERRATMFNRKRQYSRVKQRYHNEYQKKIARLQRKAKRIHKIAA